jgi:hypothetical protein
VKQLLFIIRRRHKYNPWTKHRTPDVKAGAAKHRVTVMLPKVEEERQQ